MGPPQAITAFQHMDLRDLQVGVLHPLDRYIQNMVDGRGALVSTRVLAALHIRRLIELLRC